MARGTIASQNGVLIALPMVKGGWETSNAIFEGDLHWRTGVRIALTLNDQLQSGATGSSKSQSLCGEKEGEKRGSLEARASSSLLLVNGSGNGSGNDNVGVYKKPWSRTSQYLLR